MLYNKKKVLIAVWVLLVILVIDSYAGILTRITVDKSSTLSSLIGQEDLNKELIKAAELGQIEQVKLLLDKGANVNSIDEQGVTPLMKAANIEISTILIAKGADVNIKDEDGRTALMWAHTEDSRILKILLNNGADINAIDKNGSTVLMNLVNANLNKTNKIEHLSLLIANGANVNAKNRDSRTALMYAAMRDNINALEILLNNGANINAMDKDGYTALTYAASEVCSNSMKFLLNKGAETESMRPFIPMILYRAIFKPSNEIVTTVLTLASNVDTVYGNRIPLGMAAEQGLTNMVDKLLIAGANINLKDEYEMTALMYAAQHGREITFICRNALQNLSANELKRINPYKGNTETIKLLLDNGANPDEQNKEGQTALMLAAERDYLATVKVLLASGANINIKDKNRNTALTLASKNNCRKIVTLLKNQQHLYK